MDFPLYAAINVFVEEFGILLSVGQERFVPRDLPNFFVRNLVVMDILST